MHQGQAGTHSEPVQPCNSAMHLPGACSGKPTFCGSFPPAAPIRKLPGDISFEHQNGAPALNAKWVQ